MLDLGPTFSVLSPTGCECCQNSDAREINSGEFIAESYKCLHDDGLDEPSEVPFEDGEEYDVYS
jgi:hypothetical protein